MFVLITVGLTTAKFGKYVLPPLLPTIIDALSITPFRAGLGLSVLSLFYALLQYPGGRLSDQLTRRTVIGAGLAVLVVGFLLLAATPTYVLFLAGTAAIGVGQGLYGPADRALLSDLFENRRGRAFGFHVMGTEISGVLGAGVTIAVLAIGAWRAAFLPGLVVTAALAVLLHRWSREPLALGRVRLGVRETARRLLSNRRYALLLFVYCLFSFIGQGAIGFLPTVLQANHGFTSALASATFAALFVVGMVAKPSAGELSDRLSRLAVAGGAFLLGAAGLGLLLVAPSIPVAVLAVLAFAAGHRSFPPVMQAHFMDFFPDDSMGGDLGATRTVYIGVGSAGPAYVGFVAQHLSYAAAYAGFVACFLLGAAILWWQA